MTNLALGTTLLWLPLTAAAIGRGAFIKFKFTDKRVSVITSAPWKSALTTISECSLMSNESQHEQDAFAKYYTGFTVE